MKHLVAVARDDGQIAYVEASILNAIIETSNSVFKKLRTKKIVYFFMIHENGVIYHEFVSREYKSKDNVFSYIVYEFLSLKTEKIFMMICSSLKKKNEIMRELNLQIVKDKETADILNKINGYKKVPKKQFSLLIDALSKGVSK